jgi:hypothetical protein
MRLAEYRQGLQLHGRQSPTRHRCLGVQNCWKRSPNHWARDVWRVLRFWGACERGNGQTGPIQSLRRSKSSGVRRLVRILLPSSDHTQNERHAVMRCIPTIAGIARHCRLLLIHRDRPGKSSFAPERAWQHTSWLYRESTVEIAAQPSGTSCRRSRNGGTPRLSQSSECVHVVTKNAVLAQRHPGPNRGSKTSCR